MYGALKALVARLLRTPTEPPHVPGGSYRTVEIVRASPRYLRYRLLGFYVGLTFELIGVVIAITGAFLAREPWAAGVALLAGLPVALILFVSWFAVRIEYDLRYYVITDRSLRVREGAWTVAEMTLTYANVQNVRIEQGPIQRLFGISDLVVDTAGGGSSGGPAHHSAAAGHRVKLAGLEEAAAVRDRILVYVREFSRSSGLGDLDDHPEGAAPARQLAGWDARALSALRALRDESVRFRTAAQAARRTPWK